MNRYLEETGGLLQVTVPYFLGENVRLYTTYVDVLSKKKKTNGFNH